MKIARLFAPCILLAACSSTSTSATNGEQDKGLDGAGDTAAAGAPDTNPEGIPYPSDNIGTNPRLGDRAGNKMRNYKFLGYPDGDMSQGLQPISMAKRVACRSWTIVTQSFCAGMPRWRRWNTRVRSSSTRNS